MGVSADEAKDFVEGETWLVGDEAVDRGLADEVIEEKEEDTENNLFNRFMNRIQNMYGNPYMNQANAAAVPPIANKTKSIETGGNENMAITNVEELKNAYPDLVAQVENAAKDSVKNQGAEAERARIKAIQEIENSIADKTLVNDAKYGENPLTAEQLALKAMQAQAALGNNMLNNLDDDAKDSGSKDVSANPNSGTEDGETDIEAEAMKIAEIFNKTRGGKQ